MHPILTHQFLESHAQLCPDAVLVVDGESHATYGEIESSANRVANALIEQGTAPGDRIGLLAVNSREYIESYYGILKSGGTAVSLSVAADWKTHGELLNLCGARGLICGNKLGRRAESLDTLGCLEFVLGTADEWEGKLSDASSCRFLDQGQWVAAMDDVAPNVAIAETDRAAIVYTSGSTGQPKGATLTHGNLVANTNSIVQYLCLTADDRVLVVLPFHYVYGKSLLNTHVSIGGSVVIENRFLYPQRALRTLDETGATGLSGVPSTFAILLNHTNFAQRSFPSLRYVTQAGGAMAPELQRRLLDALPDKQIFIMYGATEASARIAYLEPTDLPRKIGSIGKAIPNVELRVMREDGTEADVDEVGELVAQGENIMAGYWNDPEETAAVLDQLGYHTGDLGKRDEEGFFYVVGRSREMIKSGAHRISPKEIEEVLLEHPQVHEAAVIGVPDEILGESISAFISTRPNENLVSKEILDWCKMRLPPYKVPGMIHILKDLRRSAAGKIDKLFLAEQFA